MQTLAFDALRVSHGQEVSKSIVVEYRHYRDMQWPIVTIKTNWQPKKKQYKDTSDYSLQCFKCDGDDYKDGRGFRLTKLDDDEEVYDVWLGDDGIRQVCTCRGFESHGRCKHTAALLQLINNGTV